MECKECIELLFDCYDDEINASLKVQANEHLRGCPECQNELASISAAMDFFKENMPLLAVNSCFTKQVMSKIELEGTAAAVTKLMKGIGSVLVIFALGMFVLVGPTVIGLLMLAGNIFLGLLSTAAVVFAAFPIIQIISSIILGVLLLVVTVYMRHMLLHDSV